MSRDRRLIAGFAALAVLAAGVVGAGIVAGQTAAFLPTLIPDLQVQDDWAVLACECLARWERP